MKQKMISRFKSTCNRCNGTIKKGSQIIYDRPTKKAFHEECCIDLYEAEREARATRSYIDAQESAMFERY